MMYTRLIGVSYRSSITGMIHTAYFHKEQISQARKMVTKLESFHGKDSAWIESVPTPRRRFEEKRRDGTGRRNSFEFKSNSESDDYSAFAD